MTGIEYSMGQPFYKTTSRERPYMRHELLLVYLSYYIYIDKEMKDEIPKIVPLKTQDFDSKQSKYPMVPQLPCRSVILGPSGSGKTVLLTNLITNVYRD